MSDKRDVIILGGGLNGASLGLALSAHGVSCHIVDFGNREQMLAPEFDGRTTAIASSSMAMFEALGLGPDLAGQGCPIKSIWVSDQLKPGSLDFAPEDADDALGIMFENRIIRNALFRAVDKAENLILHMPARVVKRDIGPSGVHITLDNGAVIEGALLVAAEGRNSPTREESGFKQAKWDYEHIALVGAILHSKSHNNVAYEIFYPDGPFALLPMNAASGDALPHRSAYVWSVPRDKAEGYKKLSELAFLTEMQRMMGDMLGDIALAAPRMAYPLSFAYTAKTIGDRLVILGDAAHGIHPIAGQGLNLGLRDVATLAEVIVDGMRKGLDPADPQLLQRYERWRSLDVMAVAGSTDLLTHFFGLRGNSISALRRAGLGMVQKAGPLKKLFMGTARGTSGSLPKLLSGELV